MKKILSIFQKPLRVAIVAIVIALVAGAVGYWKLSPPTDQASAQSGAPAGAVTVADAAHPGHLTLGFLAAGRIKSVKVQAGDQVTKGALLAEIDAGNAAGALTQARAAYATAQANYQKLENGATNETLNNARTAVTTAETNLANIKSQQEVLVANAYRNLLNTSFVVTPGSDSTLYTALKAPTVSGSYKGTKEGTITFSVYASNNGQSLTISGLGQNGVAKLNTVTPEAIGTTGLFIQFPAGDTTAYTGSTWKLDIPSTQSANYVANFNAYQLALETRDQAVASAQSALNQAKAALAVVDAGPRSEDLQIAKAQLDSAYGALQIAEAAYSNTVITAPNDGTVTAVHISPGQIVTANSPAIEISSATSTNQ